MAEPEPYFDSDFTIDDENDAADREARQDDKRHG